MNKLISFFLIFAIFSCTSEEPTPYYITLVHQIISEHAEKLQREEGMLLVGSGGSLMNNVKKINLDYIAYKNFNIDQSRKFYINLTSNLLEKVNNNKNILPYLNDVPFTELNIEFDIRFHDEKNHIVSDEYVALIFLSKGYIIYTNYDHANKKYITIYREKFSEAKKIVNEQINNFNNSHKKIL